jgi:hypothetical protein
MSHRGNPAGRLRAGGPPDREDVRRPEKGPKGKYDQPEGDDEWIAKDEDWSDDYEDEKPQKGHDGHHRQYNEGKDDRYKKEDSYRGDPKRYRGARDYQDDPQASEERGRNNKSYAENHYR